MPADPRDIVTPDAFTVAPDLLGRPLARPWRRLVAMLVDLVAVGILSSLPALVLGIAGSATCVRAALRQGEPSRRLRRVLLGVLAAVILVGAVAGTFFVDGGRSTFSVGAGDQRLEMSPSQAIAFGAQLVALNTAETEDARRAAARSLVQAAAEAQPDREAVRALIGEIAKEVEGPEAKAALEAALVSEVPLSTDPPEPADVRATRRELRRAEERVKELEAELEGERRRGGGIVAFLRDAAADLGLGVGWTVVYFTAFTAWWKGRTPGKRLMKCRVIRLDGKPLTWWQAFNRAGGYAASVATGLLGFAEILWDPNRQALHDRISRTVVVRDLPSA